MSDIEFVKDLSVTETGIETGIEGLRVVDTRCAAMWVFAVVRPPA